MNPGFIVAVRYRNTDDPVISSSARTMIVALWCSLMKYAAGKARNTMPGRRIIPQVMSALCLSGLHSPHPIMSLPSHRNLLAPGHSVQLL